MTYLLAALTAAISLGFLALDACPGAMAFAMLAPITCCVSLPALGFVAMVWSSLAAWVAVRQAGKGVRLSPTVAGCVAWMLLCCALALFGVPRLAAFSYSRAEFESLAANAPVGEGPVPLNRWVGCFYVDRYAADASGAVYFRTASHADGLGPDTMSYGFALRPNAREGTPFGWSSYRQSRLTGDWYSFGVSDD
jgi:hypothetical protein